MEDTGNIRESLRPRRFEFGNDDDDLEAMQREFLTSNNKPAAVVVRRKQPPAVAPISSKVAQRQQPKATAAKTSRQEKALVADEAISNSTSATASNVLDFAQRMNEAIKEFEIKERQVNEEQHTETGTETPQRDQKVAHNPNPAPPLPPPPGKPKKLSLFAQRRLAKQSNTAGYNSTDSEATASGSATFLPKLMAPVPEHKIDEPVRAPEMKSRANGFPDIPVDVGDAQAAHEPAQTNMDKQSGDYWTKVRGEVSRENDERIKGMSESEILEAQGEIQSMVSSETIQRLLRRKQQSCASQSEIPASNVRDESADVRTGKENTKPAKQVRFAVPPIDDDESAATPPPPPPAEWVDEGSNSGSNAKESIDVDNNETGADSEFYSSMKRKYFPSEVVEEAKLAWILGHNQARSPMEQAIKANRQKDEAAVLAALGGDDGSEDIDLMQKTIAHVRFGFDGQIMTEQEADIPTSAGLHHHGDNPEKPGYTIPELLHLSRSTVPAQRTVAMATLGCILHRFNTGVWDIAQSAEVYMGLLDWQAELYFAQGISDANKTGRAEAVVTLWTWIVEMANYKNLVRLSTGGSAESQTAVKPGAEINMLPEAATARGVVVERTFKAMDSMLTATFLDTVHDIVSLSLLPEQQLSMLAECIKCLANMSDVFRQRIEEHGRLPVLLQSKFPYLMSK
ncbi:hypothetical protein GGI12_002551 [Dipsacomyces acuminosporus]|nr:hypothetical protein GGI12_002551 [Dipsacomyces acuminosporus]